MANINSNGQHLAPKVLLIEDEIQLRLTIKDVLEAYDYRVILAGNGRHGINLAKADPPDIIICDIAMPLMDGYEVVKEIRQQAELDLVPFVFLTAKHTYADLRKGMNLGADDYLVKPFRNQDLIDVVQTRLKKNDRLLKAFSRNYRLLEEYVYMNSHDIRGPLCNIIGLAQLMDRDPQFSQHKWTQMLLDSTQKLDTVIQKTNEMLVRESKSSPLAEIVKRNLEEHQKRVESFFQTEE